MCGIPIRLYIKAWSEWQEFSYPIIGKQKKYNTYSIAIIEKQKNIKRHLELCHKKNCKINLFYLELKPAFPRSLFSSALQVKCGLLLMCSIKSFCLHGGLPRACSRNRRFSSSETNSRNELKSPNSTKPLNRLFLHTEQYTS